MMTTYSNVNPAWGRMMDGKAQHEREQDMGKCLDCGRRVWRRMDGTWTDCNCYDSEQCEHAAAPKS